jgi:hypothetical protein
MNNLIKKPCASLGCRSWGDFSPFRKKNDALDIKARTSELSDVEQSRMKNISVEIKSI